MFPNPQLPMDCYSSDVTAPRPPRTLTRCSNDELSRGSLFKHYCAPLSPLSPGRAFGDKKLPHGVSSASLRRDRKRPVLLERPLFSSPVRSAPGVPRTFRLRRIHMKHADKHGAVKWRSLFPACWGGLSLSPWGEKCTFIYPYKRAQLTNLVLKINHNLEL